MDCSVEIIAKSIESAIAVSEENYRLMAASAYKEISRKFHTICGTEGWK